MKTNDRPTRGQVKAEPAGLRLDAWVAEHLFGRRRYTYGHGTRSHLVPPDDAVGGFYEPAPPGMALADTQRVMIPAYSVLIAAAWSVVEKVGGMVIEDWRRDPPKSGPGWSAIVTLPNGHDTGQIVAETAPLAICRAALLAVLTPGYGE